MGRQKRYYYIRVVVDGEKYRTMGFCNKSDFTKHLDRELKHPFFYCDGYSITHRGESTIYQIEFWRADGHNGNHYFLGSLSGFHPSTYALPLVTYTTPLQPILFFKEEARDPMALGLKLIHENTFSRTIIIGKEKLNLPLGYHK